MKQLSVGYFVSWFREIDTIFDIPNKTPIVTCDELPNCLAADYNREWYFSSRMHALHIVCGLKMA